MYCGKTILTGAIKIPKEVAAEVDAAFGRTDAYKPAVRDCQFEDEIRIAPEG